MDGEIMYLHQVDKCRQYGTSKHVMFFRLFPEQGQVLNQAAYIWSDLERKQKMRESKYKHHCENSQGMKNTFDRMWVTNFIWMIKLLL